MILRADSIEKKCFCQGRRYAEGGRLFLNHSGATLKGLFRGKTLVLTVGSEPIEKGRNAYVRLITELGTKRLRLPAGIKQIELTFPEGEHSFELIKLTESANNTLALIELKTEGAFLPVKEKKTFKIEFVGDSITTGFGVLCREKYGEYKTKEQDVTKAFPHLVARALNAEYHVIAAGGWGIARSKYSPYYIPDCYDAVDLTRNTDQWDFSRFRPDCIVVALGTNDFSYLADLSEEKRAEERAAVKARFSAFLKHLLSQGAEIVLLYGFFDYPDLGVMTREVAEELHSPRIRILETESMTALDDVRAGHPGQKTHRIAAKKLVACIKELLAN